MVGLYSNIRGGWVSRVVGELVCKGIGREWTGWWVGLVVSWLGLLGKVVGIRGRALVQNINICLATFFFFKWVL